jgi:hypothetical protein
MIKRGKFILAVLCGSAVALAAVGMASARNLSISNSSIRMTWARLEFRTERTTSKCEVTLEGSFHSRTMQKVRETLIGLLTRADVTSCEGGRVTFLTGTLPWHMRYRSFSGTLPAFTGVAINNVGMAWLMEPMPGISCLYRATEGQPALTEASVSARGEVLGISESASANIPLFAGTFCPPASAITGTGRVTLLGTTTAVSMTLI